MSRSRVPSAGQAEGRRRKHRSRPVPKWLKSQEGLDAIARSRCLMVLSVLSGEKPVTDAIKQARISRGAYYQMETRALNAMLAALNPMATVVQKPAKEPRSQAAQIDTLLGRIKALEQDKRRTQRLLLLTRKAVSSPVKTGRPGRLPADWIPSGKRRSPVSKATTIAPPASTPTKAGETAP